MLERKPFSISYITHEADANTMSLEAGDFWLTVET